MAGNPPTQNGRIGKLATPLGKDKLCLARFEGDEAIGELFEYRVEAVSAEPNIDFRPALGKLCSVHLDTADRVGRDFSGLLTEATWAGTRLNLHHYRLVLRPWPWLLTLRSHSRIFANMNVKDIVKRALGDNRFGQIVDLMVEDYPTLEYTVQYRETSLNFAMRMMEKFGIYFYFKFDKGDGGSPSDHQIVLADSATHELLPAPNTIRYVPPSISAARNAQVFSDWSRQQNVIAGIFELNDYDYIKPGAYLLTHEAYPTPPERSRVYDYPGGYDNKDLGDRLTVIRQEAEHSLEDRCTAGGYAPSLMPGFAIQRTSPDGDPQDDDYLILRCSHFYGDQAYASSGPGGGASDGAYSGNYELSRFSIPYRMPLKTRRPVITGTQPAKVISKENQEIDVDEMGRALVEFYWEDTTGSSAPDKTPSRRVRVGQFWAGAVRGSLFLPRVGDEVMVEYENGDPDRPIIVGSVYNGDNTIPMFLPMAKNNSGILTKSTPDSKGYNFLLFKDTAGQEAVKLRCQRDLMFKALRNEQRDIGGSQTENVGGDETINVGNPDGGGNFTINAYETIKLNVGPADAPLTQIKMDQESITLSVGIEGAIAQIKLDPTGVTISGTMASQLLVQPQGITTLTPMTVFTYGPVGFLSPMVTIPLVSIGAGTVGGITPIV